MYGVIMYPSGYWLLNSGYIINYKKLLNFKLWFLVINFTGGVGINWIKPDL
jgi:hypothetical protein